MCKQAHLHVNEIKTRITNYSNIHIKDYFDYTPFHYICENSSYSSQEVYNDLVTFFIVNGASLNSINWFGESPFYFMCNNIHVSIKLIKLAYEHNADIHYKTSDNTNILHSICHNYLADINLVNYVMTLGGYKYINSKDNDNNTPLHYICQNQNLLNIPFISLFMDDINTKNKYGNTPFSYLCSNWSISYSTLKYFISNGANTEVQNYYGSIPFHYLCKNHKVTFKMLKTFLNIYNINYKNSDNITPLHLLMENSHVSDKIVKKTLKYASINTLKDMTNSATIPHKRKLYVYLETIETIIVDDTMPFMFY